VSGELVPTPVGGWGARAAVTGIGGGGKDGGGGQGIGGGAGGGSREAALAMMKQLLQVRIVRGMA
jgi:hypothetical protein